MYRVQDLEKATQFYLEVFGLKIGWKDKEEEMVGLNLPETDTEIVLHKDTTLPNPAISFQVENVEKCCRDYQKAAQLTRKRPAPIIGRYTWQAKQEVQRIDFTQLATEIKEVVNKNVWNLYQYIHRSKILGLLNESMSYGHNTLRVHLLMIANMMVQDFDLPAKDEYSQTPKSRSQMKGED